MSGHMTLEERKKIFDNCMSLYKARIVVCAGRVRANGCSSVRTVS
jgi:hypothetical protein